jgi:hypothetical protein
MISVCLGRGCVLPPWSGGGGYRGGGGGSYSGRGGYTPVGYSPTDGGGGSGGTIASIVELGVLAVFVGHVIVDTRRRNRAFEVVPTADVDVGVLHVSLDARVRPLVQRELVRNANGVITTGEPGVPVAHADDGPGLVLVTLIVASRRGASSTTSRPSGRIGCWARSRACRSRAGARSSPPRSCGRPPTPSSASAP